MPPTTPRAITWALMATALTALVACSAPTSPQDLQSRENRALAETYLLPPRHPWKPVSLHTAALGIGSQAAVQRLRTQCAWYREFTTATTRHNTAEATAALGNVDRVLTTVSGGRADSSYRSYVTGLHAGARAGDPTGIALFLLTNCRTSPQATTAPATGGAR